MKKSHCIIFFFSLAFLIVQISGLQVANAQTAMMNTQARHVTSLNGKWQVIVDPLDGGNWKQIWKDRKPEKKTDFVEYSFRRQPYAECSG